MAQLQNDQQERLAQQYAATLDVKKSAERAGYSESGARNALGKPHVRDRVREIQQQAAERLHITQDKIVQEIAALAFSNVVEVMEARQVSVEALRALPVRVQKAIKKIEQHDHFDKEGTHIRTTTRVEMHNKIEAQKLLTLLYTRGDGALDPNGEDGEDGRHAKPDQWGINVYTLPQPGRGEETAHGSDAAGGDEPA